MHQKMRDFWNKLKNGQEVSRPLAIIADSSSGMCLSLVWCSYHVFELFFSRLFQFTYIVCTDTDF